MVIRLLRIEAFRRSGISNYGVIKVTKQDPRNGSLHFTKQNPNYDSSSLITGTSLTHYLGVVHLLHTDRRGNKERRQEDRKKRRGDRWRRQVEETRRGRKEKKQ